MSNPPFAPKEPASWARYDRLPNVVFQGPQGQPVDELLAFRRGRLKVTSSVGEMGFRGEMRWQWLVAISAGDWRASDSDVERVLRDFGMSAAEEDNHRPGRIRSFFLLCEPRAGEEGLQCECKETEETVVEPDGYRWQRERGGDHVGAAKGGDRG